MDQSTQSEEKVRNLRLRQTWIAEQVEAVRDQCDYPTPGDAFQALIYGLLFDLDYESIQPGEIVDDGQDKQIDIIRIDDDPENTTAHVHIVQAKHTDGFSSNVLIQLRNGLGWVFERPKSEYSSLSNSTFVNKIDEIRQLRLDYGASNIAVSVYFVTAGDSQDLSDEYLQERKILTDTFSNAGFSEFNFRELGAFELIEILNEGERAKRKINLDIPITYDVNRPSLIEYRSGDTRAFICTVTGLVLAEIASSEPRDAIFDLNVRPFYGSRGRVNRDILATCTSDEANRFWFLNNGVTMTCDSFDWNSDPDKPIVKVRNAQIVNGCQTSVTIREASEKGELREDVRVLLRIYATDNPGLADRITLTTNNQNRITDRDLRANDSVQVDIEKRMEEMYGYFYERKNRQFRGLRGSQRRRVVPNYKAAQAYLAIVRQKPSVARGYLGKIWSEHYQEIFSGSTVGDLLVSFLIYRYCAEQSRAASRTPSLSHLESELRVYGAFHLARVCGFLLTNDRWGNRNRQLVDKLIKDIDSDQNVLEPVYTEAMEIMKQLRTESVKKQPNPTLYFKAGEVQRELAKMLGTMKAKMSDENSI